VISLDALRGITVALMLLVNNPGSWSHIYTPLAHAPWNGCTLADLVFPFFLFCVGASIALSFHRTLARGTPRRDMLIHALRRAMILVALGLFLNALSILLPAMPGRGTASWDSFRWCGVLQRIGITFFACSVMVLYVPGRWHLVLSVLILTAYTQLIGSAPELSPSNPAAVIDAIFIPARHMYRGGPLDPEGLCSTVPAIVSVLIGYWTTRAFMPRIGTREASFGLVGAGLAMLAVGALVSLATPVNKQLWTSSYVLVTGGGAMIAWGLLHHIAEVRSIQGPLLPAVIFGSNAIFAFVASGIVGRLMGTIAAGFTATGDPISVNAWLFALTSQWPSDPRFASLLFAIATVSAWFAVHFVLHHRKIFFKV
jgi:predicted acyltransferase